MKTGTSRLRFYGTIMILYGSIQTILALINLGKVTGTKPTKVLFYGNDITSPYTISALLLSLLVLLAGTIGVCNAEKYHHGKLCIVFGILSYVTQIIKICYRMIDTGTFYIAGLLGILIATGYIIGSKQNMEYYTSFETNRAN